MVMFVFDKHSCQSPVSDPELERRLEYSERDVNWEAPPHPREGRGRESRKQEMVRNIQETGSTKVFGQLRGGGGLMFRFLV